MPERRPPAHAAYRPPRRSRALPVAFLVVALLCVGLAFAGESRTTPTPPQIHAQVVDSPTRTTWGPTRDEVALAVAYVDQMSLPEQAGQVIVASYRGTGAPTAEVRRLHLGGVIAGTANIGSLRQIREVNRQLAAEYARRGYPGFLSVDQEGGTVARVTRYATRWPSFMAAGAADDTDLTRKVAAASGGELAGLGFTVDLAPDADVTAGDRDPAIGTRSAGGSPALVARHVVAFARGLADAGIVPVLKHFPGHGSVSTDSHRGLPVQRKTQEALLTSDLVPFQDAIGDGIPAVMTGHIAVLSEDPGVPASLSAKVTTGLLRDQLGFGGLVVTDALDMTAVTARYPDAQAVVQALASGADVVLMPRDPRRARDSIVRAVRSGDLSRNRLSQAAARMLATLIHTKAQGSRPTAPGSGAALSLRLSRAALTSVSGPCSGRLVRKHVRVYGPDALRRAFKRDGHRVGLRFGKGPKVYLVPYGARAPRKADVVVALDRPGVLGRTRARVRLATYGDTDASIRALVDVLVGHARAPGRLPVAVPGVPRRGC